MKKLVIRTLILSLLLAACSGGPPARTGGNSSSGAAGSSRAQAGQALSDMDAAFEGRPVQNSAPPAASPPRNSAAEPSRGGSSAPPPVQTSTGGRKPAWVDDAYSGYPRADYVAATGYGQSRPAAEQNALAALTGFFGQNIQAELRSVESYTQAVSHGSLSFSENASLENAIRTTNQLDTLIGAEIRAVWDSGRGAFHALAVMEKSRSRQLYADMIRANDRLVAELVNLSPRDRNSLDGYARYRFAGVIADVSQIYGRVLSMMGGVPGIDPSSMPSGDDYRLEAANIARSIPVTLEITDDRANRIHGALAAALSQAGFRTGRNGRYVLRAVVTLAEADFPGQNKWCRYSIEAGLIDTVNNSVVYPFSASGREGHLSMSEAENRAVRKIEERIGETYAQGLSAYLETLLLR